MESDVGTDNEGVRLALYFQRKAPSINSAFDILADKAIFEVVRTALNLPASMSQADIERQADILISRVEPGRLPRTPPSSRNSSPALPPSTT